MAATDQEVFDAWSGVPIDHDNIEHYRALLSRRLVINRCTGCGYYIYPHRPLCPVCLTWDPVPTEVSGKGHLFMYTLIHQDRDPTSELGTPEVVAAIELEERVGLRYLAPLVNCSPADLALDMPVQLTWIERDGLPAPAFEPRGDR